MKGKHTQIFLTVLLVVLLVIGGGFLYYNVSSPLAMYPGEAKDMLKKGRFDHVVDVRTDAEWNMGHFPLAIHIPLKEIAVKLPRQIPEKKARILFYCNTSTRSRMAAETAEKLGYTHVNYLVGIYTNIL
jgi:rhodanese-related sulfurtransferase